MRPLLLMILDGYGIGNKDNSNAIYMAKTPNMDKLFETCPNTFLRASGLDVGLPDGQMGNSEVGHTNIGAGRVVYQELTRITKAIKDGEFFSNAVLENAMDNCVRNNSALHIMGLLSDGGVHSHIEHLFAIVKMAKDAGISKIYIHALMDGRDVSPTSGIEFVKVTNAELAKIGAGTIATINGRYYAMDRDNRWDRVERAYNAIAKGVGEKGEDAVEVVANSYKNDVTDEFIVPTVIGDYNGVSSKDSFVFFNFRPDRAREITRCFVDEDFSGFDRGEAIKPVYVCMTQYDATMPNVSVAFTPQELTNTLGEFLSKCGKTQLRIAETEKYAHVTFFFNGGVETVFSGEDRILIASPKVATYDQKPEMSAFEVCDKVVEAIKCDKYDVIILNFANCDMVGHTGIFEAAVNAVEAVDSCVGRVCSAVAEMNGITLITADHGNADKMFEEDGSPFTAHTTNIVPFIMVGGDKGLSDGGNLADIAPTIIELLDLEIPPQMSGKSLLI